MNRATFDINYKSINEKFDSRIKSLNEERVRELSRLESQFRSHQEYNERMQNRSIEQTKQL